MLRHEVNCQSSTKVLKREKNKKEKEKRDEN